MARPSVPHRTPRPSYRPAAVPGYVPYDKKQGGKYERGYRNIYNNTEITRRDYLDKQAQAAGWSSQAQYAAVAKSAGGLGGVQSGTSQLILATMNNAGIAPQERRETARRHSAELKALARNPDSLAHDGPLAKWLEAIGLREKNAPYDVGDTQKVGIK